MKFISRIVILLSYCLLTSVSLYAEESLPSSDDLFASDADPLAGMMQLLEQETELATRSKLNADYVPGMVTVLDGRDLEAMGFQRVWDAMSVVPGMTTISNAVGEFGVTVRGVSPVFGVGKLLWLVNGRRTDSGIRGSGPAITFRLAMVDRIEVIRGPGSSIYGGNAYSGVVNVILKKGNSVAMRSTNQGNHTAEWLLDTGDAGELQANLMITGKSFKGSGTRSGTDMMYQLGNAANSHAPGPINDRVKYGTINTDIHWRDYSFHALYTQSKNGDFFGINNTLSAPGQGGYFDFRDANFYLERRWQSDHSQGLLRLGHKRNNMYEITPIMAAGFTTIATLPVVGPTAVTYPDGMLQQIHYTENKESIEAEWRGQWMNDHNLLLGGNVDFSRAYDPWFLTNYDLATRLPFNVTTFLGSGTIVPLGWQNNSGASNWIKEGIHRNEQAIYLQDEWHVSESMRITAGIRYDRFSDVGSNVSPRLAAVYSLHDRHIFKAQFATAFRPPTFLEMYLTGTTGFLSGRSNLKAERSNNVDLSYIYKIPSLTLRTTIYYSRLKDLIINDINNRYTNLGSGSRQGGELEYEWLVQPGIRLQGNISYSATRDDTSGQAIVASTRWLSNTMIHADISRYWQVHILSQYIGQRARQPGDPRAMAPSFLNWNATLSHQVPWLKGLSASIGVFNLFNRDKVYPSMMTTNPANPATTIQTYPGDYSANGRQLWAQLKYEM